MLRFRPRVLLVEDNEINQEVMVELLSQLGYLVEVAADGAQALDSLRLKSFSAILMDCQMPVMDGYAATREIRNTLGNTQVPIIAVTAHAIVGEREKALSAGMDDYLTKPVTRVSVRNILEKWIRSAPPSHPRISTASSDPKGAPARTVEDERPALDPSVVRSVKVMQLFLKHVPPQLTGIEEAVKLSDEQLVKERAHKLKGGSHAVGALRMALLCERLECLPDDSFKLVEHLLAEYAEVEAQMRAALEQRAPAPELMSGGVQV
jgi:CheY-like chemotaxis protein/HPt (histidine-containing phosphotransfer) domain-containing protein